MTAVAQLQESHDLKRELQELNRILDRLEEQASRTAPGSAPSSPGEVGTFSTLSMADGGMPDYSTLEVLRGSPGAPISSMSRPHSGPAGRMGLFEATSDYDMQFLDGYLQGQVSDLIQKLNGYVRQYGNLVDCVPIVTQCVQLYGQGQYVKALSKGYEAYRCIQARLD